MIFKIRANKAKKKQKPNLPVTPTELLRSNTQVSSPLRSVPSTLLHFNPVGIVFTVGLHKYDINQFSICMYRYHQHWSDEVTVLFFISAIFLVICSSCGLY